MIPEDWGGIITFGLGLHNSDVEEFLESSRPQLGGEMLCFRCNR